MKTLFHSLIIVLAAGIGLVVGVALRGKSVPEDKNVPATNQSAAASPGKFRQRSVVRVDDSPLTTKLARDLSMSKGVTRWLYWLEAIEKAVPADFLRLAKLAQGNSTATRLIAA